MCDFNTKLVNTWTELESAFTDSQLLTVPMAKSVQTSWLDGPGRLLPSPAPGCSEPMHPSRGCSAALARAPWPVLRLPRSSADCASHSSAHLAMHPKSLYYLLIICRKEARRSLEEAGTRWCFHKIPFSPKHLAHCLLTSSWVTRPVFCDSRRQGLISIPSHRSSWRCVITEKSFLLPLLCRFSL